MQASDVMALKWRLEAALEAAPSRGKTLAAARDGAPRGKAPADVLGPLLAAVKDNPQLLQVLLTMLLANPELLEGLAQALAGALRRSEPGREPRDDAPARPPAPPVTTAATPLWPDEIRISVSTILRPTRAGGEGVDHEELAGVLSGRNTLDDDSKVWIDTEVSGGGVGLRVEHDENPHLRWIGEYVCVSPKGSESLLVGDGAVKRDGRAGHEQPDGESFWSSDRFTKSRGMSAVVRVHGKGGPYRIYRRIRRPDGVLVRSDEVVIPRVA